MNQKRVFHDPIHKEIVIDSSKEEEMMIMELIETFAFQRLRRIKQLGAASLIFHGAESSRFTHSIGVFCVARKIFNRLTEIKEDFTKEKFILFGAALLHDLGHGPLSHTSEEIFSHSHEYWSKRIIQNYAPINSILKKFGDDIPDKIGELFSDKENFISNPIKTLVSSEIDCDRLDYLLRDSYNTGTNYGLVDLERIISALTFSPDGCIAIKPKGIIAIEHFLILRNIMYRSIYNHRINEICSWILEKIIFVVKNEFNQSIWIDRVMQKWIFNKEDLDFDDFLANDDIKLFYHLNRWKEDGSGSLSILCKMFLDRNLLKASDITFLSNIKKLELLANIKKKCDANNLDSSLFCGIKEKRFNGFETNNSLKIWDGNFLSPPQNASELIKTLSQSYDNSLLIYPECLKDDVKKQILVFKNEQ